MDQLVGEFHLDGCPRRDAPRVAGRRPARLAAHLRIPSSGAVGLEAETGDLILGGNVEFPGTDLATTIHGEGFVLRPGLRSGRHDRRSWPSARRVRAATAARRSSRPRAGIDLELIDPLGHTLTMADLYPWPFAPDDLGEAGVVPGSLPWPDLRAADDPRIDAATAAALVDAGRHAHAPYGRSPAAIVLGLADGGMVSGASIENVAFDPSIGPLQAAVVDLLAHRHGYAAISSATLATTAGGNVQPSASIRALLATIAPGVPLVGDHLELIAASPGATHRTEASHMGQIHLHAEDGDYAPVVLLPGDPNRATRMAARFDGGLEATRLVNSNRGLLGYTGTLGGVPVSVQTTMMGTPTTTIVMEELVNLGVTTFIRVGTCGGFGALQTGDVVVALAAASLSGIGHVPGWRRADRAHGRYRRRPRPGRGESGRRPDHACRADRHVRRLLRPAPGRRHPLGSPRLPRGGDGIGRGLPARDA